MSGSCRETGIWDPGGAGVLGGTGVWPGVGCLCRAPRVLAIRHPQMDWGGLGPCTAPCPTLLPGAREPQHSGLPWYAGPQSLPAAPPLPSTTEEPVVHMYLLQLLAWLPHQWTRGGATVWNKAPINRDPGCSFLAGWALLTKALGSPAISQAPTGQPQNSGHSQSIGNATLIQQSPKK